MKGIKGVLNRLPSAGVGDMVLATVKKGKPELRKKVMPAVVIRQKKAWRRKDGIFLYFEGALVTRCVLCGTPCGSLIREELLVRVCVRTKETWFGAGTGTLIRRVFRGGVLPASCLETVVGEVCELFAGALVASLWAVWFV